MSSIRKLKTGRYQADYQDRFRDLPRTKRTFNTKKEAAEWLEAVKRDATARLLGHQRRRLFGEALAKYLREESPKKRTHHDDLSNAKALRWPIWDADGRRWLRLEETPLDETPLVLAKWIADLKAVVRRGYVGGNLYHLRPRADGVLAWHQQPDPNAGERPPARAEVTDPELLAELTASPGRGPFNTGTLRARQLLAHRVLHVAWKYWSMANDVWLTQNVAEKIHLERASEARQGFLGYDQLLALLIAAPVGFDEAILAGAWIGWRRANILGRAKRAARAEIPGLEWSNVVFPVYEQAADLRLVQPGYIWKDRKETKKNKPLAQPMSDRVEQLLRLRWESRSGRLVFHRGDGSAFHEFRSVWRTTKRRAGIDAKFRWHDLRHTFASEMIQANVGDRHLQELMGHSNIATTQIYAHLRIEHLRDAVNAPNSHKGKQQ